MALERPLGRTLWIRRRDGSLAGAYRFAGSDLVAFQWQAGEQDELSEGLACERRLGSRNSWQHSSRE